MDKQEAANTYINNLEKSLPKWGVRALDIRDDLSILLEVNIDSTTTTTVEIFAGMPVNVVKRLTRLMIGEMRAINNYQRKLDDLALDYERQKQDLGTAHAVEMARFQALIDKINSKA